MDRQENEWIIEQSSPEFSLEAQMMRPKLFYFRHIMWRSSSLEKGLLYWEKLKEREEKVTCHRVGKFSYCGDECNAGSLEGPD